MAKSKRKPTKKPLKVYGYVRVSTEDQAREGLSVDAQKAKIKAYTALHDLELVEILTDEGFSGKNLKRPGIQKLLKMVSGKEVEGIIIYKLDRLCRTTRDLLKLVEEVFTEGNTRFFSISEQIDTKTAIGKFFLTLMGALAQMERELIAERTKATLQYKRQKGEHLGAVPFGFDKVDDKLVKNDEEQKIIRKMKRWKKEGKSLREIARRLNAAGIPTKRKGVKWSHRSLPYILQ